MDLKMTNCDWKMFSWDGSKMLLGNHIAELLNQLYLEYEFMNQLDIWYLDIDLRNGKDGL